MFQYEPLDQTHDCIRLLEISPIRKLWVPLPHYHLQIQCTIKHVKFSERPEYEALSYMWGDDAEKHEIRINGETFKVATNLYHALWFLRARAAGNPLRFWIDAMCINQRDVEEKTRQIRLMPHIYFRATTVVVWLGGRWFTDRNHISEAEKQKGGWLRTSQCAMTPMSGVKAGPYVTRMPTTRGVRDGLDRNNPNLDLSRGLFKPKMTRKEWMAEHAYKLLTPGNLGRDKYWERVWIIQEIGKATRIEVGLIATISQGTSGAQTIDETIACTFPWGGFIKGVTRKDWAGGPIRLDQQLRQKYSGGHTLRALLETHQSAKCGVPHDKIYGLVGLAEDSHGFVMDYRKSQLEVWKDTVLFLNPVSEASVARFARLCSRLLTGGAGSTDLAEELAISIAASKDPTTAGGGEAPMPRRLFTLGLTFVGMVTYVGPNPEDIVKYAESVDHWTTSIKRNNGNKGLSDITRENDHLMKALLKFEEGSMRADVAPIVFGDYLKVKPCGDFEVSALTTRSPIPSPSTLPQPARTSMWEHRLYQLGVTTQESTLCSLGVTIACVEPKDIVCRISGTLDCLLLRQGTGAHKGEWRIIGTAWRPHDAAMFQLLGKPVAPTDMKTKVDINTLYAIFSPRLDTLLYHPVWRSQAA